MAGTGWSTTTADSSIVGGGSVATSAPTKATLSNPTTTVQVTPNSTLADTIHNIQTKIALLGHGPHLPHQREQLHSLSLLLQKAQAQQAVMTTPTCMVATPTRMLAMPQVAVSPFSSQTSSSTAGVTGAVKVESGAVPGMASLTAGGSNSSVPSTPPSGGRTATATASAAYAAGDSRVLDKRRLQELIKEVDPLEQLDDDVEETLMQIADDFIDNVVTAACQIAKHRKANTVEVKDVQLHLERNWNMWIPGFGSEELRPFKKSAVTEAHKQRMALIKKTLKKY